MIIIIFLIRNKRNIIAKKIVEKRKTGENSKMKDMAVKFIDKDCLVYTFDGRQYDGIIKEVSEGAVLIEKDEKLEALNLDFVLRIREYPKNKKGKKKSVVLD